MSRNERWNSLHEIERICKRSEDPCRGAGPVIARGFVNDSENHVCVLGNSGKGKSQCQSLPIMQDILRHSESLIVADPKGEGYRYLGSTIPDHYQKFVINLRYPRRSPTTWNPLTMIRDLYHSEDPDDQDRAMEMLNVLANGIYPHDPNADQFWINSSREYFIGLVMGLLETADDEEVTLDSVTEMMSKSESRMGDESYLQIFFDALPETSLARRYLESYLSGPKDTRGSVHSVASSGLSVFSRSRGLMELLSEDSLDIRSLDVSRPFALIIIIPDETDAYDVLAGLLVSQLCFHLTRQAEELGGRLPVRCHILLEELGTVGRGIPDLPKLISVSRSRNIRLYLVLQTLSQLEDVFGRSRAKTIRSCIGITVCFSTNNWDTLQEFSQRCGEREIEFSGHLVKEPLITPTQLAAMPTGTALVIIDNAYKIITPLPFFYETFDFAGWTPPELPPAAAPRSIKVFNFTQHVRDLKIKKQQERITRSQEEKRKAAEERQKMEEMWKAENPVRSDPPGRKPSLASFFTKQEPQPADKGCTVVILNHRNHAEKVAVTISQLMDISPDLALYRMEKLPLKLTFLTKERARDAQKKLTSAGAFAIIE